MVVVAAAIVAVAVAVAAAVADVACWCRCPGKFGLISFYNDSCHRQSVWSDRFFNFSIMIVDDRNPLQSSQNLQRKKQTRAISITGEFRLCAKERKVVRV